MKQILLRGAEILCLFAALAFTLPYLPSHEISRLPLLPGGAFAVVLFATSRALRWRTNYLVIGGEALLFVVFVYCANTVTNLLYSL